MKMYMQTMYEICDGMDDVWVSNYEYIDDDPALRAFFIAFLFDIDEFKYYEEVYKYCHDFCDQLENLIKRKLKGCYWDKKFEVDEMAFCKLYLTPFFKKIGFEQVIFNHGNKEFGKDFILVTKNLFGIKEYYGVQAKAGSLSGTATSNITEITNQINMGFNVPYKMVSGEDVYITKMIVAISGNYTDNAQAIIQTSVDKYKFANIIFLYNNPQYNTAADIVKVRKSTKSHVSTSLKLLEDKGLVEKKRSEDNKKHIEIFLLDSAQEIVQAGLSVQKEFVNNMFQGLTEEEMVMCKRVFSKICNNAENHLKDR